MLTGWGFQRGAHQNPLRGKRDFGWALGCLEEAWASAAGSRPPTCNGSWSAAGGHRRDFMVGCSLAVAAVLSCKVQADRWVARHLAVRTLFDCCRWTGRVTQSVQRTHLWPASSLPANDKNRSSNSVEVKRVWDVYDERLQFMSRREVLHLDESLDAGDVSRAWLVWSRAVEAALADAYRFSGGPLPSRGLVFGRGGASFRVVRLGGHQVRKARGNIADAHDAADVFLYRDSSIAPLLDMSRRFKAVMDVLGSRRDGPIRRWRNWIREDPMVHPYRWLRPDLVSLAPFLQCEPHLTPGGSGVLSDPARIDEEFRKAWLPYVCRSGQRDTSLEEFDGEVEGWLPLLPEVYLPRLTGQMLADVVQRKSVTAGSLDGWGVEGNEGSACFLV